MKNNELVDVLMKRDNYNIEEAVDLVQQARADMLNYDDVDELMEDWFGLEPDYFFDLLWSVNDLEAYKTFVKTGDTPLEWDRPS